MGDEKEALPDEPVVDEDGIEEALAEEPVVFGGNAQPLSEEELDQLTSEGDN